MKPFEKRPISNFSLFDKLDSFGAFILGFIFTDGSLFSHENYDLPYLRIYNSARYKIENAKTILGIDSDIRHIPEKYYKGIKQGELFYLHISQEEIIEELMDFGMVLRKNTNIKFPILPKELYPAFIRGLWSGKGSVSISKTTIRSSFSLGSKDFIYDLEDYLNKVDLSKRKIQARPQKKSTSYKLTYGVRDTKLLYDYLYKDHDLLTTCKKQEKMMREYFEYRAKHVPNAIENKKPKRSIKIKKSKQR